MPIATCQKCQCEFIAADVPSGMLTCPSCGERFASSVSRGGRPAQAMGWSAVWLTAMLVGLGVLVDGLAGVGAVWRLIQSGGLLEFAGRATAGAGLLLAGLAGHGLLSVGALAPLVNRPRLAVLFLRLALACWLIPGGIGIGLGARMWPAQLVGRPVILLVFAGLVLVVLLGYLAVLERLAGGVAARAAGRSRRPAGQTWRAVAGSLLVVNLVVLFAAGTGAFWAFRQQLLPSALLGCLGCGGLALYVVWACIGLGRGWTRPDEARRTLPLATGALLVGIVLALLAWQGLGRWPDWLTWSVSAGLVADWLAVWATHWRLTPAASPPPGP